MFLAASSNELNGDKRIAWSGAPALNSLVQVVVCLSVCCHMASDVPGSLCLVAWSGSSSPKFTCLPVLLLDCCHTQTFSFSDVHSSLCLVFLYF